MRDAASRDVQPSNSTVEEDLELTCSFCGSDVKEWQARNTYEWHLLIERIVSGDGSDEDYAEARRIFGGEGE